MRKRNREFKFSCSIFCCCLIQSIGQFIELNANMVRDVNVTKDRFMNNYCLIFRTIGCLVRWKNGPVNWIIYHRKPWWSGRVVERSIPELQVDPHCKRSVLGLCLVCRLWILQTHWCVTSPPLMTQNADVTPDLVRNPSVYADKYLFGLKVRFAGSTCRCDDQLLTFCCVSLFGKVACCVVSCCVVDVRSCFLDIQI